MRAPRQHNDGLRKRCACPRRAWAKCRHPWHFDFKWRAERYRFSLSHEIRRVVRGADGAWERDRGTLGKAITNKTGAERERDRLRTAIAEGKLHALDQPSRETLTLAQLIDAYQRRYLDPRGSAPQNAQRLRVIGQTALERIDGARAPLAAWCVQDITTDAIEQYQQQRAAAAPIGVNRDLAQLRALFAWAVRRDYLDRTPFKKGTETIIRLPKEAPRRRRLQPGEGDRLLAACGPHLRAVVECALETGMRRGEILSLQWSQVRWTPRAELLLPAAKTKTKADRTIPISSRLQAVLEMRRQAPDGAAQPPEAYVFGNEVGERVQNVKRAWQRALLVAHGHRAQYVTKPARMPQDARSGGRPAKPQRTALLTPDSQAALRAIDLHFHDLRREAGSRWLDAGIPLHRIQKWLGHASIAMTSVYLMADSMEDDDAMARYEAYRRRVTPCDTNSETGAQTTTLGEMTAKKIPKENTRKHQMVQ